jgi:hypothetical protein
MTPRPKRFLLRTAALGSAAVAAGVLACSSTPDTSDAGATGSNPARPLDGSAPDARGSVGIDASVPLDSNTPEAMFDDVVTGVQPAPVDGGEEGGDN